MVPIILLDPSLLKFDMLNPNRWLLLKLVIYILWTNSRHKFVRANKIFSYS